CSLAFFFYRSESMSRPLLVEIIAYAPTAFYHCTHCEVAGRELGATNRIHEEQVESSLPDDLIQEYQVVSDWVKEMFRVHCDRIILKVIDAASLEGVGKTVMAGATAIWLAKQGRRVMLASTNPVHSLSGLLSQNVFGKATPVVDVENLWAYEIDTKDTIEGSKQEIREKIQWFLKFADISTKAEDFVESATMNPAFEESSMFENMVDLMLKNEYDVYVFDTAPTANARRLLGMSKVYSLWVNKMLKSREEARSLRELLSFTKKKEADPLMDYLVSFRDRMGQAQKLLTDDQLTAFFFVTLAE